MKNFNTFWAILLFCLIGQTSFAQFTLQASDINPTVGYGFRNINSSVIVESNNAITGTNATWDFTTLNNNSTDTATVIAPSSTPYAASFPQANIAFSSIPNIENTDFEFFRADVSAFTSYGNTYEDQGEIFTLIYSTPMTYWTYPLNYNDQSAGTFSASSVLPGDLTQYQFGTINRMVDGYGTLKLPFGDYDETMRIKVNTQTIDSTEFNPGEFTTTQFNNVIYFYLRAGTFMPLLIQNESTITAQNGLPIPPQTFKSIIYLAKTSINVLSNNKVNTPTFQLFPNPANEYIQIKNLSQTLSIGATYQLMDVSGRVIETGSLNNNQGEFNQTISVQNLPSGIYFLHLMDQGRISSKKFIKH